MPADAHTRLTLDLDTAADPVAGVLRDGNGHAVAFSGWMALARAIDLTLEAARGESDAGAHPPAA